MATGAQAADAASVARGYFEAVGRRDVEAMTAALNLKTRLLRRRR